MDRLARVIDEVMELIAVDQFYPVGVGSGDRLVLYAFKEGSAQAALLLPGGSVVRLTREPVSMVMEVPYGSERVLVARDVARGAELHSLIEVRLDEPGVERRLPLEPVRIFNAVDAGGEAIVSLSTRDEIAVYSVSSRGSRRVARLPGLGFVVDVRGGTAAGIGLWASKPGASHLFTLNLDTGEVKVHVEEAGSVATASIAGDGSIVFAVERASGAELRRLDPDNMRVEDLRLGSKFESYRPASINFIGFTVKGGMLVVARRNGRSRLFLDGEPLDTPEGMLYSAYEWRGRIVVGHSSLRRPLRVIEAGSGEPVVEGKAPWWLDEALGPVELVWVESSDGEKVPTYVLESRRAPKPGPTVVLVHGGPFAEDADTWSALKASLAAAGFHVVMPNYRGSVGYGDEWRLKIVGDPCGGELEDVVAAARWAVESGLASRVYIAGYSYGGYMTMCALTRKPGLFKAGVAGASVVDWEEMYELSDAAFKSFIELLFAGRKDLMRERSPINYIDSLQEPLCIIHPQNDSRTPLKPVLRFMQAALEKGKTFEAHIAPDMGHAVNTKEDAAKILLPLVEFLIRVEERLRGR